MNLESINEDQELREFLAASKVTDASTNLVNRILEIARNRKQNNAWFDFYSAIQELIAEIRIPRPIYTLACVLILGFVIGFNNASDLSTQPTIGTDLANDFLYDEGELI